MGTMKGSSLAESDAKRGGVGELVSGEGKKNKKKAGVRRNAQGLQEVASQKHQGGRHG